MDVTQIPFNKFIEISRVNPEEPLLTLAFKENLKNHLGTFHASGQFALAEACSGLALQKYFPHLANSVVPVLRKSEIKFKKPAQSDIRARAEITPEAKEKFRRFFAKKNRASITVSVEVSDQGGTISMTGAFEWFVQKI